jgi:hypothetical protein
MSDFINLNSYTPLELILFATGCYMWVIVYFLYARNIHRHKMIGMPVFAAASNFGWEFVWSFIPPFTDMGLLCLWGYRLWFIFDLYIFYGVLKYGSAQVSIPDIKKYFRPIIAAIAVAWAVLYYLFKLQGLDTVIGAHSAYIAQSLISFLYLILLLRHHKLVWSSYTVSWLRTLGSGLISAFMFLHYPTDYFLLALAGICPVVDIIYLIVFHHRVKIEHAVATGA